MSEQILKVLQEKTPNEVTLLTSEPPPATHSESTSTVRPKTTVKPAMENTESVSRQIATDQQIYTSPLLAVLPVFLVTQGKRI